MSKRYTFDEIKQKFMIYRELEHFALRENEFEFLCNILHILPKEIVDDLDNNADFVLLSDPPDRVYRGCKIEFDDNLKKKKILIRMPPNWLGPEIDENIYKNFVYTWTWGILQEIAHFYRGDRPFKDPLDQELKEMEASKLVRKWYDDLARDLSGDSKEER